MAYAGEGVFTVSSNGVRVIFASENFKQDAVLPNTDDFHLFGWSGRSRYHVTDFYGVAFVRANGAYAGDFLDWERFWRIKASGARSRRTSGCIFFRPVLMRSPLVGRLLLGSRRA